MPGKNKKVFIVPSSGRELVISKVSATTMFAATVAAFREMRLGVEYWNSLDDDGHQLAVRGVVNKTLGYLAQKKYITADEEALKAGYREWRNKANDLADELGISRPSFTGLAPDVVHRNVVIGIFCPDDLMDKMSLWASVMEFSGLSGMMDGNSIRRAMKAAGEAA